MFDWLFRSRTTGRITVAQWPNTALWLFIAAFAGGWIVDPHGRPRSVLTGLAAGALVWWAVDELIRGVNPWRRLLGAVVLAARLSRHLT